MIRTLEQRQILDQAAKIRRDEKKALGKSRKQDKRATARARAEAPAPGQRDPRQLDEAFVAWLHDGIPCIAGLIEGGCAGPIEAAHQKLAIAGKGWAGTGLGPRAHDARCAPLCARHHRLAPNSCDTGGQRKFWDRLGLGDGVADLCRALHAAFLAGQPGGPVVRGFVSKRATITSEGAG